MARKQNDPKRAVGYIRVSTDEQALGPQAQRAALERWCKANGAELVCVHQDLGVSGGAGLEARPALLAAMDALREHAAGVLLIAKRDRLARDVVIAAMATRLAEKAGARILTADGAGNGDGPEAGLMRGMIDLFAEYERALIRVRTKAALAVKKAKGERAGQVPFGYALAADGVHLVAVPAEQAVIEQIRLLRAEGLTVRGIAELLNRRATPARGTRWHATSVARVLRRTAAL